MSARSLCTITASTKRNEDLGSGRTGDPAAYLVGLLVTPLYPVSQETIQLFEINSPREVKECYHVPAAGAGLPDVKEGDILVHGGVEYPIAFCGEWPHGYVPTLHLILGEVKSG